MRSKLVRDKIPEIVGMYGHHSKKTAHFKKVESHRAMKELLEAKLQEEAAEFLLDPSAEELADIIEVIEALRPFFPKVDDVRETKALQKGTYEHGYVMTLGDD